MSCRLLLRSESLDAMLGEREGAAPGSSASDALAANRAAAVGGFVRERVFHKHLILVLAAVCTGLGVSMNLDFAAEPLLVGTERPPLRDDLACPNTTSHLCIPLCGWRVPLPGVHKPRGFQGQGSGAVKSGAHWEDQVFFSRPHTAPVDTGRSASRAWLRPASFHARYLFARVTEV